MPETTKKPWTWKTSNFVARFKSYDEKTLKPMFVRKYVKVLKDDNFQPAVNNAGTDAA